MWVLFFYFPPTAITPCAACHICNLHRVKVTGDVKAPRIYSRGPIHFIETSPVQVMLHTHTFYIIENLVIWGKKRKRKKNENAEEDKEEF